MDVTTVAEDAQAQSWCVAYTLPRHEKVVAQRLDAQSIVSYVPVYSEVRQWRQRRVEIELPLFPGYVFVRMIAADKGRVLSHPGVVRLLTANGNIAVLPDDEMEALQLSLARWKAQPYPFFTSGKRIRIRSGPFAGLAGTILRRNGKRRLVVTLDLIQSSMLLELSPAETELSN